MKTYHKAMEAGYWKVSKTASSASMAWLDEADSWVENWIGSRNHTFTTRHSRPRLREGRLQRESKRWHLWIPAKFMPE